MTETVAAMSALSRHPTASVARKEAFDAFLARWKNDANVSCTYLSLAAGWRAVWTAKRRWRTSGPVGGVGRVRREGAQ